MAVLSTWSVFVTVSYHHGPCLFSSRGELHLVFIVWVGHSRTSDVPVHSAHTVT